MTGLVIIVEVELFIVRLQTDMLSVVAKHYEGRLVLSIITRSGTSSTQVGTYTLNDSPTGGHTPIGLSWNEDQQRIYVVWRNSSGYTATVQAATQTSNGTYTSFTVGSCNCTF